MDLIFILFKLIICKHDISLNSYVKLVCCVVVRTIVVTCMTVLGNENVPNTRVKIFVVLL